MKKNTMILCILIAFFLQSNAQILNQNANWPNAGWLVTGTFNSDPLAFEADPTVTVNFAFDDDDAGNPSDDDIAAESPEIDLTAAHTAGETAITISGDYVYNYVINDELVFQYWDTAATAWVTWGSPFASDTSGAPFNDYCAGPSESYTTNVLNIVAFTASQLSGFKYRISYDDDPNGTDWNWGFCFQSPTITSATPSSCPGPTALAVSNITTTSADLSWTENGTATVWDVELLDISVGETVTGTATNTEVANPFNATGLVAFNMYEFYVRADCGSSVSNWIGPFAFTHTPPLTNDDCANAIALTPGVVYADNPIDGTVTSATTDAETADCGLTGPGVWYSLVVPTDGNITIETGPDAGTGNTGFNSVIEVFSGACGALTSIDCDDDGAATGAFSQLDLTGLTGGDIIYIRVWEYAGGQDEPFSISAFSATLGVESINANKNALTYFPNPVKHALTLKAKNNIQKISVYTMLGQEILRIVPNRVDSELNMSVLSDGAYLVRVTINEVIKTVRVIKH